MTPQFFQAKRFFDNMSLPRSVYQNLWMENTTTLFHTPRSITNKTHAAIAIADEIAKAGRDVIYITTQPTLNGCSSNAEKLHLYTPEFESVDDKRDYADLIFDAIEHAVRTTTIRTFIVDSVTRIAALSFGRNASAAYVMKRFVAMQVKFKLSLLVLADDNSRSTTRALVALADSEITESPDGDTEPDSTDATDAPSAAQPPRQQQTYFSPFKLYRPIPGPVLSRQQRRALQRQQAKLR